MTVTIPYDSSIGQNWLKQIQANFQAIEDAQLIALASEAEVITGTNDTKGITPAGFAAGFAAALATYRSLDEVNIPVDADITVGSQVSTTINVAIQLKNLDDENIPVPVGIKAYLADSYDGTDLAGTAPDGHVAIGTDGLLLPVVTDKVFELVSEATGTIDLDIVESGTDSWYLVLILPNGNLVISDEIAFSGS